MKIILASTSPRRQSLLREVGFEFEAIAPKTEEIVRRGESPKAMVLRLAREKAEAVERMLPKRGEYVVIAADTTVVSPNGRTVLGKPEKGAREAERMLRSIAGREHTVYTGYAVAYVRNGARAYAHERAVRTRVRMKKLSATAIAGYVSTGEPMDKAGAYGAQGIGMVLIESIRGSYTNVVGLPMTELCEDLETHFGVLPRWNRAQKKKR